MFALIWTPHFILTAKKFAQTHPHLHKKLAQIIRYLEIDPLLQHLRLHPLKGKFAGLHAVSLTCSHRIP